MRQTLTLAANKLDVMNIIKYGFLFGFLLIPYSVQASALGMTLAAQYGQLEYIFWPQHYKLNGVSDGSKSSGYSYGLTLKPRILLFPNLRIYQSKFTGTSLHYKKDELTAYYNLLNGNYGKLGLGWGITQVSGTSYLRLESESFSEYKTHGYANLELGPASVPVRLYMQGSRTDGLSDLSLGIKYRLNLNVISLEFKGGYRRLNLDMQRFGALDYHVKSRIDGYFAGVKIALF